MLTLAAPVGYREEIKKSRFLATAERVDDRTAARAFCARAAQAEASHNCWAYRIGSEYRFFDDGEPGGTAGQPILAAIDGRDLDHVAVLVARHFGGIKLGAGGLIRAYGGCAAKCLDRADTIVVEPRTRLALHAGFDALGAVYPLLARFGAEHGSERYDTKGVLLQVEVDESKVAALGAALRDATRGRATLEKET